MYSLKEDVQEDKRIICQLLIAIVHAQNKSGFVIIPNYSNEMVASVWEIIQPWTEALHLKALML